METRSAAGSGDTEVYNPLGASMHLPSRYLNVSLQQPQVALHSLRDEGTPPFLAD